MASPTYATRAEAKKAGWHSRRHQTSAPQAEAREAYKRRSGREARRNRAALAAIVRFMTGNYYTPGLRR